MSCLIDYNHFVSELQKTVYKIAKSDLINKIAEAPDRYVGIFRPTTPELKLIQNITHSHEISFGDFIEDIITEYLGYYYVNLPKRVMYNNDELLFDQLFEYDNKIFMIEQKMRDDHDSSNKKGQFEKIETKIKYLIKTYPNKEINAGLWFVDSTLKKNKNFYLNSISKIHLPNVNVFLFYGDELLTYLDKINIWNELEDYLIKWKMSQDNKIELNFEINWPDVKKELLNNVPAKNWKKIIANKDLVNQILPILFPTKKYKEILDDLGIQY